MEIFLKSRRQLVLEHGVPSIMVAILTLGYFFDGHMDLIGSLVLAGGTAIVVAVLVDRMPIKLTLRGDALAISYNRGDDLVIPYKNISPSIVNINSLRIRYTDREGKKKLTILGAYWCKDGVSINNIVVIQALEQAAKGNFDY